METSKPKKLIRSRITEKLKEGEWEEITDQKELNQLYCTKIIEELQEIKNSNFTDINEFVDLIQVAFAFTKLNGFQIENIQLALLDKSSEKGMFGRKALNNLNPNNPSNKLYFPESAETILDKYYPSDRTVFREAILKAMEEYANQK